MDSVPVSPCATCQWGGRKRGAQEEGVKLEIESRRGSLVRVDVAVNEARLRGHLPRGNKLAAKVANEHTS